VQCYRNLNSSYAVESDIMEALMAFVISIEAPENEAPRGDPEKRGEEIFREQKCHDCHSGPSYTSGRVIDWKMIGTDPERIRNGFPKGYKVPSLLRLDLARLYLHDGSLTALEQLFDPSRLDRSYTPPGIPPERQTRGAGVPGHEFGMRLAPEEREALVAFLKSL
jgi:cytochrome c peroxidase